MTAGFSIRHARPEDIDGARAIMIRTFEEDFGTGYQPAIHTDVADLSAFYVERPRHALLVAVDDSTGEVVGTGAVRDGALKRGLSPEHLVERYDPRTTAQLVRVYVLREHRRRGIARALVGAAYQFILSDPEYQLIALHTYPHSPGAVAFWDSIGTRLVADDTGGPSQALFYEITLEDARRAAGAAPGEAVA